jgi:isoleucyl-tRNA synthetase
MLANVNAELRELLNVSQLTVETHAEGETDAVIAHADGQKCERCWHWETDIGKTPAYPMLCGRCVAALS